MAKRILIIDDDPDIVAVTQAKFQLNGYDVSTAFNGLSALELLEKEKADLIIADIIMPEMDGFTFYKIFRSREEFREIPVIILTALSRLEDSFIELGVQGFLAKPFAPHDLVVKVEEILT